MFTISKIFRFEAAHSLPHLPASHPCHRKHGHGYVATFYLRAETLDRNGMVEDYRDLDDVKRIIDDTLDHRDLDEVFEPLFTTAENIARRLFDVVIKSHPSLVAVRVSETPGTSAEYRP